MSSLPLFSFDVAADEPALRPYQAKGLDRLRADIGKGLRRILFVGPCGMGKMVCIASIIRTSKLPVLVVAHRMELIDQCVAELAKLGITRVGVIRGDDERSDASAPVQVASIQTLRNRPKPFGEKRILVLIDEAHRSASETYMTHVFQAYPDAVVIGFTASPTRLDGKPLGSQFQKLEQVTTYAELLKNPLWLASPDVYGAPISPDLSEVRTLAGDFEEGELGEVMSAAPLVGQVVKHWTELAHLHPVYIDRAPEPGKRGGPRKMRLPGRLESGARRRTFLFAVNLHHSRALCEEFSKAGVRIEHLDGMTPERTRRRMLADLASGRIEIISNCNVLLEGVDVPSAKCVLHARPTKSLVLWLQSTGRILRPWQSVTPLVLDHAENFERHGAPHEDRVWSLDSRAPRPSGDSMKKCPRCQAYNPRHALVCFACTGEFPRASAERALPQETDATLEMKPDALRASSPDDPARKRIYDAAVAKAQLKSLKPGFASFRYKEIFGTWPPRSWSDETRALFSGDTMWQAAVALKEVRKRDVSAQEDLDRRAFEARFEEERARRVYAGATQPDDFVADSAAFGFVGAAGDAAAAEPPVMACESDTDESFGDWIREQLSR